MGRKAIPLKIRFEVFKRDSFTCQYCGQEAPNIVLNVDHINPVKNGGDNNILNLITSCFGCNNGKRAILLDDNNVIRKQKQSLNELQERKNQIEMIAEWRKDLLNVNDLKTNKLCDYILSGWNYEIDIAQRRKLQTITNKFDLNLVYDSIERAFDNYSDRNYHDAKAVAFSKIGGICYNIKNDVRNEFNLLYDKANILFEHFEKNDKPIYKWQKAVTMSLLRKMNKIYPVDDMKWVYQGWASDIYWEEWREDIEEHVKGCVERNSKFDKKQLENLNKSL